MCIRDSAAREGHFEEIFTALALCGEVNSLAVPADTEFRNREIRRLEERSLRLRLPVVEVEIPAVRFERRPPLRADENRRAVGREHRADVRCRIRDGQLL